MLRTVAMGALLLTVVLCVALLFAAVLLGGVGR